MGKQYPSKLFVGEGGKPFAGFSALAEGVAAGGTVRDEDCVTLPVKAFNVRGSWFFWWIEAYDANTEHTGWLIGFFFTKRTATKVADQLRRAYLAGREEWMNV